MDAAAIAFPRSSSTTRFRQYRNAPDRRQTRWRTGAGYLSEGRRWLKALLEIGGSLTTARARSRYHAAMLSFMQGDHEAASPFIEQGLDASVELRYALGEVRCLHLQAALAAMHLQFERSAQLLDTTLPKFEEEGSSYMRAMWLYARAQAARAMGHPEHAAQVATEGLALSRQDHGMGDSARVILLGHLQLYDDPAAAARCCGKAWRSADSCAIGRGQPMASRAWGGPAPLSASTIEPRLLGAAEAVRNSIAMGLFPIWQADHARAETTAPGAMGEKAYEAAASTGRGLRLEDAIAHALGDGVHLPNGEAQVNPLVAGLTAREREVAALLGRGFSNRQIAEGLVISEGTAAIHVRNILSKLGFSSRAQITAWAVRLDLDR